MKSFKSTASKIKNPSFFFNKSPLILNRPTSFVPPSQVGGGARVGKGAVHPSPPLYFTCPCGRFIRFSLNLENQQIFFIIKSATFFLFLRKFSQIKIKDGHEAPESLVCVYFWDYNENDTTFSLQL